MLSYAILNSGETIKKKYASILDMLKKERLTFGNQLEGLEFQLKKQEDEITKLKVIIAKDFIWFLILNCLTAHGAGTSERCISI